MMIFDAGKKNCESVFGRVRELRALCLGAM